MEARTPSRLNFLLMSVCFGLGLAIILVGTSSSDQPFASSLKTDFAKFEINALSATDPMPVQELQISFQGEVTGPFGKLSSEEVEGERLLLRVGDTSHTNSPNENGTRTAIATLESISLPVDSSVTLQYDEHNQEVGMLLNDAAIDLRVVPQVGAYIWLENPICLADNNCPEIEFKAFDEVVQISSNRLDDLQLSFQKARPDQPIADMAFLGKLQVWERTETSVGTIKRSGLIGGLIHFINTPGRSREFFRGEIVDIEADSLIVRSLSAQADGLQMQVSGNLRNASVEVGESRSSLMPTWFDVLSNNSRVRYALGLATIMLGLLQLFGWDTLRTWRQKK